jgi:hypothetical protein
VKTLTKPKIKAPKPAWGPAPKPAQGSAMPDAKYSPGPQ